MNIIDLHCDTISKIYHERQRHKNTGLRKNSFQVDLLKMKSSGYLLQNFAIFLDLGETDDPYGTFCRQLAVFEEEMNNNSDLISPVTSFQQILTNQRQGKMSALLTLEEGEACGGSLKRLQEIYHCGVRMMTFTWNFPNTLGFPAEPAPSCSDYSRSETGLTARGREFLAEMERLGIIADVSHLSDQGILDVCKFASKPFCASHSNARSLCRRGRNLPDHLICKIAERGGLIGANFYGPFLSNTPNSQNQYVSYVKDIAQHIRHIADAGGISCIGLGSDFDGIDDNLELKDCSQMELLEDELKKSGFHINEIEQIFYQNVLKFYQELL